MTKPITLEGAVPRVGDRIRFFLGLRTVEATVLRVFEVGGPAMTPGLYVEHDAAEISGIRHVDSVEVLGRAS